MLNYWTNGVAQLYQGDARALPIADRSVHCCVTSPPYWGLRDYGLADWEGGDPGCDHRKRTTHIGIHKDFRDPQYLNSVQFAWPGGVCGHCGARQQVAGIGLEPTLSEWLENIVAVGREVWRVLRDDGTWWLNLGDAYVGSGKGRNVDGTPSKILADSKQATHVGSTNGLIPGKRTPRGPGSGRWGMGDTAVDGVPAKSLMGQPWRAAFALQDWGWILRSAIVWHKPNPMPESVTDRPTNAYEMVFLLTKRDRYFYDAEVVREPSKGYTGRIGFGSAPDRQDNNREYRADGSAGANLRNVWAIPTQGRPDAHFASFPDELPQRCILAGTSERGVCADCGAPWVRVVEKSTEYDHVTTAAGKTKDGPYANQSGDGLGTHDIRHGVRTSTQTVGWQPTCDCGADTVPATVLDPFIGRGTTAIVAQRLGRRSIGVDLNPDYLALAQRNIEAVTLPLI